jgi:protein-tyrosine phosphatase
LGLPVVSFAEASRIESDRVMSERRTVGVLFVCMGNICRSPTAQGIFRRFIRDAGLDQVIEIDSAGTHAYHLGEPPDLRAQETARQRGIDLGDLRARRVEPEDFERFDYVLAMDQDNYHSLCAICPPGMERRLNLLMDYAPQLRSREVPDPYYGGESGFERVFDMLEAAAEGLLADIRRRHF